MKILTEKFPGVHMSLKRFSCLLAFAAFFAIPALAQFNSNVQGAVQDSSGAVVPKATVSLVNAGTRVTQTTTSDADGNYRFVSLAPGAYKLTVAASGYSTSELTITLLTEQNLNVPVVLKVGSITENVTVTTATPIVDTGDSRTQLTLENQAVAELPIQGRNLVTLVTLAPGVSGLGTSGSAGAPGSGADNFSTETAVDASANGQGADNNQYLIDGLDITSAIRQGVLNLTPTPDSIQETSVQVNTFSPEHSRGAGLQVAFTTRSGTDQFHGSAADYFNYQKMFAAQHFHGPYTPFHANDFSFAVGGPVIRDRLFFYFAAEPRRGSNGAGGLVTFADPAFLTFISNPANGLSNNVGTHILNTYRPKGLSGITVKQTAQGVLGTGASGCNTASTNFIPCATPMVDQGTFGATAIRNGTQYFARLDPVFKNDRVYVSFYRTLLLSGAASASPEFSSFNPTWQVAGQVTWSHNFSPTTLNEASAGLNRIEGQLATGAKDYTVPNISAGISQQLGAGFAQGDFIQHNYHWRDVLTHVRGAHTLKVGYEGWYGDDVEPFQGPWSTPSFSFNNILALAQDAPNTEGGVMYDPATGTQKLWDWNAASRTFGLFVEDSWKARRNLTLTLGLRYDDSGNPWSKSPTTIFGNFYLGQGATIQDRVASGVAKPTHNALQSSVNNLFSPRIGFAWDPKGDGNWAIRGGFGVYNNWLTSANIQEEFRGSPPGLVTPTFVAGGTATAQAPIFVQGNSSKPPFGFIFPTFQGGLNAQGGQIGANLNIGGIDPNVKSPKANVWSATVERKISNKFAAAVGYSGSHSYNLVGGSNSTTNVSYGVNINVLNNDLILNNSTTNLTRLNPSFGAITYAQNDRYANYEGVYFEFKGHFSRGFVDASYTHSASKDDAGVYPTPFNPGAYYGPSLWDVPNRVSISFNYSLKGLNNGNGAIGHLTSGWGLSGTSIYQSGNPFTVVAFNNYRPVCAGAGTCPSAGNPATGYALSSGDYNADGVNNDVPDASSYKQNRSQKAFLTAGSLSTGSFSVPNFGSEGNEKQGQFREPNFFGTDINLYKDTRITERVNFQFRFEVFNVFNRANLINVDNNFDDRVVDKLNPANNPGNNNFGLATNSHLPRWWQIGGKISF
ncbi:MAG TPA: carboxypeptidase regulatory-like domain-containing protein [Terriglobales bacterium]|jgi:hypothetical protein|nr:carboxypeptidase regulatory-like domain-containing protein [Terriglobales bacterium]